MSLAETFRRNADPDPDREAPLGHHDHLAGVTRQSVFLFCLYRHRTAAFAIITTTPNELCTELHNRMPVILKPEVWPEWLGEEPTDSPRLKALLSPYPSDEMTCWPVSSRVGSVKNNDPSLIEPIAGVG
jgi:putative SOS response-associated peptidase YedK